jgi:hypothetical protein
VLVVHQLSQSTFGRVLSLRDTETGQVALRPIAGKTRKAQHREVLTLTPTDHAIAELFGSQQMEVMWSANIPDVDPLWAQWDADGLITAELLADVPEPTEAVFTRTKSAKLAAIDNWLSGKESAGIDVGNGIVLKGDANAAVQLSVYLSSLSEGEPILVSDVNGKPHIVDPKDLPALAAAYKTELVTRRTTWATLRNTIDAATTLEELTAITIPD